MYEEIIIFLLITVMLVLQMSCSNLFNDDQTETTVDISEAYYYITNNPSDFYRVTASVRPSLEYCFEVVLTGDFIESDIKYIRIYLPDDSGDYWDLTDYYDSQSNSYWGYFYDGDNTRELPIGSMQVVVELNDATKASKTIRMPIPGHKDTDSYSYVYASEDYIYPSSLSVEALKRPTVTDMTVTTNTISIDFRIDDENVYTGDVWFYNSDGTYLGDSPSFTSSTDGSIAPNLNSGDYYNTEGESNTFIVTKSSISYDGAHISSDIADTISACRVVVFDGKQYTSDNVYNCFDYRAVSELFDAE